MKTRLLVIFAFSMLIAALVLPNSVARSGGNGWIKLIEVDILHGQRVDEFFEGSQYNITFSINVTSGSNTNLTLCINLEHATLEDRYWQLHPPYPPVVDWDPNSRCNKLRQNIGVWVISCFGKIPDDITIQREGSIELHKMVENYVAVELKDPQNYILGNVTLDVIDAKIKEYRTLNSTKEGVVAKMRNAKVVPQYIDLCEKILAEARKESSIGFVDEAISLLNLLPSNTDGLPPIPQPSFMETMFIPAVAGLSAAIVLVGILTFRWRGKLGYTLRVLEDQVKDLEGVIMKASRVDKSISTRLESIRDRLKNLVGV